MKVVLAGAFGHLGTQILKCLCAQGHEVVAADARSASHVDGLLTNGGPPPTLSSGSGISNLSNAFASDKPRRLESSFLLKNKLLSTYLLRAAGNGAVYTS